MAGCNKNDSDPEPEMEECKRMTLVYAINRSSLAPDFIADSKEMLKGLEQVGRDQRLLVYRTDSITSTGIYEATYKGGKWDWKLKKEYKRTVTSTDPDRMHQVISDAISMYPDAKHTLYFWGHGSSWTPVFSSHSTGYSGSPSKNDVPDVAAFGGEYGEGNKTDYINLPELVNAIPDNTFDIIWFDSCYMASVEVAYQLRNKCRWLVGYPTEVWSSGLNYNDVLPYMLRNEPDIVGAASTFYDYYNRSSDPVTITVMDLSQIEGIAAEAGRLFKLYHETPSVSYVSNYGRFDFHYYDFIQLMEEKCGSESLADLKVALDKFIIFHKESSTNFSKRTWVKTPLCGISIHNFTDKGDVADNYYKTLDWYKDTME